MLMSLHFHRVFLDARKNYYSEGYYFIRRDEVAQKYVNYQISQHNS